MILPEDIKARHALYRNLYRECGTSRADRGARYTRLRSGYLAGRVETSTPMLYNGLREYVRDATAQLYDPPAVRFGVVLPPHYGMDYHEELQALTTEAHRLWHDTPMTLTFLAGVEWARVLGVAIFKNITSDRDPVLEMIPDPSDVGVWNELLPLSEQEAVCHWYDYPMARFARLAAGYSNGARMVEVARQHERPPRSSAAGLPPAMSQIILSSGGGQGVVRRTPDMPWTTAQGDEPCAGMAELWVRDDRLECFRRVGIFPDTDDILWEEPQGPQYDDAHCFHGLTYQDVPGYMWGLSPMEGMIALNEWEQTRWGDVDLFVQLQLDPPYFLRGIQGRDGEKLTRVRKPGGEISSNDPTAEVKSLAPPAALLPDVFALIDGIRKLRDRQAGLSSGQRGEAQANARSGGQEATLLGESSALLRQDAAKIEACAGDVMTQILRMQRRRSGMTLVKANGEKFLPINVPGDLVARVAAHTASPLYAARRQQQAILLRREHLITAERYVEMLDPAFADIIAQEARVLERAQAEGAKEKQQLTVAVAKAKIDKDESKAQKDRETPP